METNEHARERDLDSDAPLRAVDAEERGCCSFTVNGTTQQSSDVTRSQCIKLATAAGATEFDWSPGDC